MVAKACGEERGNTEIAATSPAGLILTGPTEATPGEAMIHVRSRCSAAPAAAVLAGSRTAGVRAGPLVAVAPAPAPGLGSFATTSKGPLKPLPKPCAISS